MTASHAAKRGDRRTSPLGGGEVFDGTAWHGVHTPAGRAVIETAPAASELPSNVEAEQALLGALLFEGETVLSLDLSIKAEHFFEPLHGRLFEAIADQIRKGRAVDPALLSGRFAKDEAWAELGGTRYLGDLLDRAPPAANAGDYAREIATMHTRRELMRLGGVISAIGAAGAGDDSTELVAEAERVIADVSGGVSSGAKLKRAGAMVRDAIAYARSRTAIIDHPTGLRDLDEVLGGLHAGEVTILAARPGMGKTVGAQTIARAHAAAGKGVCFFSLEMSEHALGLRLASDVAFDRNAPRYLGVTSNPTADKAMKGQLHEEQWAKLNAAQEAVADWPLYVDSRPALTLSQIESAARKALLAWKRKGVAPGLIVIDHLGRVRPSTDRRGNKHAEVADVSNGVAEMAKRLEIPVLALVQLNRGVEGRDDKRPVLSDLRQAGELEEDARQVVFLYRPEYYLREPTDTESFEAKTKRLEELQRVENQLFWIVEKNSHGPRGQVRTFCDIACSAIRDWEPAR